ncbi:methyl-accepting chemotaxis protein [Sedimentibacter sp. MB31-C6]|uniref:methyl-accepting chemotaxis protein n=1 Tax=Sedimentibacter sp. MB31-C6 TaxID=3109366 RepID=UPI002DDCEE94|nr:methyl-accepting chemotaxis protein [Sedimentibacter sp. MB36-C1]WSI04408.1 methyl-accepting chemotaxis protein [Sedimentibacter sp. MB36-C1]
MKFKNKSRVRENVNKTGAKSIKGKLLLVLFIVCLLVFSVTGAIISVMVNNHFSDNEKEILYETAHGVSNEANTFFQRYITIVQQMANDKNIQNFLVNTKPGDNIKEVEGFMTVAKTTEETQQTDSEVIISAYIAEGDPSYYLVSPTIYSDMTYDVTAKEYYKSVTEGIICITDPYIDAITGKLVITISAPVYVNNKIVGLTAVDIGIDKLSKAVGEYKLGDTGNFALLTKVNTVAMHNNKDNILKSINEIDLGDNIIQSINNKNKDVVEYLYQGEKYLGNSVEIGDTGWKVLSFLPKDEFTSNTIQLILIIITVYIFAIAILLVILAAVIGKMTKPIKKITEVTNKLALGELDVDINIKSNDEIGELAKSIDSLTKRLKSYIIYINESVMVLDEFAMGNLVMDLENDYKGEFAKLKGALEKVSSTLKDIIGRIKDSSDSININAEQVSSGSQALAQGTTEQASSIEELSAEINEIYSTIVANAENAENAGKKALESANEVDKGNAQMKEMLDAIDEISMSSSEIGKIIKVIDDIAFQTNILALNAAVEAARAGSAGKGFAVVADEVRNLAGKSAEAAKQTTSLIENSITAINKGTSLADEAGKSLSGIVSKTKETNDLITEIVNASAQQTVSVNQIRDGIEQISSVVQENAATAEASAANSEELSGQVQILKELIDNFNVEEKVVSNS